MEPSLPLHSPPEPFQSYLTAQRFLTTDVLHVSLATLRFYMPGKDFPLDIVFMLIIRRPLAYIVEEMVEEIFYSSSFPSNLTRE